MISWQGDYEGDCALRTRARVHSRQIRLVELAGEIGDGHFGDRERRYVSSRSDAGQNGQNDVDASSTDGTGSWLSSLDSFYSPSLQRCGCPNWPHHS